MKRLILASILLSITMRAQEVPSPGASRHPLPQAGEGTDVILTFDEAVVLAGANRSRPAFTPSRSEIAALRRSVLPSVRAEVMGNVSRTLELFGDDPFDIRSTTSVLAFDYPLWDGGLTRARIESAETKLRRLADPGRVDDGRFIQLVEAFGQLYLAQRQRELLRPLYERLSDEVKRSALLVSLGEVTNLVAADWREVALSFGSQLLELEARRIDAAAKLEWITGLEHEPTVVIDLQQSLPETTAGGPFRDDQMSALRFAVEDSRLRLRELIASTRFRLSLSGFVGFSAAESAFRDVTAAGAFGVYALRLHLTYPFFGGAAAINIAEARAALEQTLVWQDVALEAARARAAEYRLRIQTAEKRIDLYRASIEVANEREESLQRLVHGGVRTQNELIRAEAERTRRESELLAAEVERWKASRLLARMTRPSEDVHR